MSYSIIVQDTAIEDARGFADFIRKDGSSTAAARWLDSFEAVLRSLAEMPNRYKAIEEQEAFEIPLRQVLHHSHRVIYHVNERTRTVHILRVYHGARRPLTAGDIRDLE